MALQHSSFTYFFPNRLIISCVCLSICFLDSYFSNTASLTRVPTCHMLEKSSCKNDSMQRFSLSVYTRLTMCPLTCPQRNIEVDQAEQLWPFINLERSSACLINPSVFSGTTVNANRSSSVQRIFKISDSVDQYFFYLQYTKPCLCSPTFLITVEIFPVLYIFTSIIYPVLFSR